MVYFHFENLDLGKFWWALEWKMLVFCMVIWNILWPFGNLVVIRTFSPFWYIVSRKIWQPCLGLILDALIISIS
jgi:hypothetical protein